VTPPNHMPSETAHKWLDSHNNDNSSTTATASRSNVNAAIAMQYYLSNTELLAILYKCVSIK